jgi:hypothetical protein
MRAAGWLHFAISSTRFYSLILVPTQIKANSYGGRNNTHFSPYDKPLKSTTRFKNTSILKRCRLQNYDVYNR